MIKKIRQFFAPAKTGNPFYELTREERLAITAAADAAWERNSR